MVPTNSTLKSATIWKLSLGKASTKVLLKICQPHKQPNITETISIFSFMLVYRQFHTSSTLLPTAISIAGSGKILTLYIGLKTDSVDETRFRNKNSRNVS